MVNILIIFDSRSGNTQKIAEGIYQGAKSIEGCDVRIKKVNQVDNQDLQKADAIVVGSPTYFGTMSASIKEMLDKSVAIRGKLENKIGAAFSTSAHPSGGKETTILSILQAMLIHGMIIIGDPISTGGHYGIAAKSPVTEEDMEDAKAFGKRIGEITKKFKRERVPSGPTL